MLHRKSFEQLRAAYRARELSPVRVIESALAHAEEANSTLNAFAMLDHERALAAAAQSEDRWVAGNPLGPLDGMPFTVKEFAAVKGWPTRRGSVVTSPEPVGQSAAFVDRLTRGGAVIFGKTRAPEFNWKGVTDSPGYGVTRNPIDVRLTPGGSSGGCSAAVAAGVVRASIGSDAGGSVRIPAAFTGTVALKPTFGRIPLAPPPSAYFDIVHTGPIAASVAELAEVMSVVAGPNSGDGSSVGLRELDYLRTPDTSGLRIGLLEPQRWADSDSTVKRGMQEAVDLLAAGGYEISTVDFDVQRGLQVGAFFYRLGCLAAVEAVPEADRARLDPALLEFIDPVRGTRLEDVQLMRLARDQLTGQLHGLFDRIDVLALPTMPIVAFEAGRNAPQGWASDDWMSWNPYTPAFNITQVPALSFPIWPEGASLPMGLQLVAARGRDDLLIALAGWLESRRPVRLVP